MKKFKAHHSFLEITEHECVKETDHLVTIMQNGKPVKQGKITQYDSWHDTFDDAVNFLMVMEHKKLQGILEKAQYHRDRIDEINNLKNPATTLRGGDQVIHGADLS